MRITHTSALHGFAVFSAGTALFASAMLAGAGAANAATVTSPDQAAVGATQSQPGLSHQYGEEHCWRHHKHGKKDDEHGKKDDKSSWGEKKDHSKADSESDDMSGWGGKKDDEHGKKDDEHGKGDSEKSDKSSWGDKKDDEHGKKDDHSKWEGKHESGDESYGSEDGHSRCEMPTGSVESGRGGAALASSQSSTTTISLGALAALMLGSGVWTLYRSRRTRVHSAVK